jgi:hypothetical protein
MKKIIRRIDLKAHEVARTITLYQLDARREIKLDTLRCIKLRKVLAKHVNGIRVLEDALLTIVLDEIEYRQIIGINIIKSLKI